MKEEWRVRKWRYREAEGRKGRQGSEWEKEGGEKEVSGAGVEETGQGRFLAGGGGTSSSFGVSCS